MRCPRCGSARVRVIDSREALRGHEVRRRRLCLDCQSRFTTRERADLEVWHVVKRDGRLEPYDGAKFRHSLRLAMGKLPASDSLVEHAAANAERVCRRKYPDAAPTEALGRAAVAALPAIASAPNELIVDWMMRLETENSAPWIPAGMPIFRISLKQSPWKRICFRNSRLASRTEVIA